MKPNGALVDCSLGEWLQGVRRRLGLTQEELAQKLGITTKTMQRYEADEREPKTGAFLPIMHDLIQAKIQAILKDNSRLADTLLTEEQFTKEGWEQYQKDQAETNQLNKEIKVMGRERPTDQASSDRAVEIMMRKCQISFSLLITIEQLMEHEPVDA